MLLWQRVIGKEMPQKGWVNLNLLGMMMVYCHNWTKDGLDEEPPCRASPSLHKRLASWLAPWATRRRGRGVAIWRLESRKMFWTCPDGPLSRTGDARAAHLRCENSQRVTECLLFNGAGEVMRSSFGGPVFSSRTLHDPS